MSSVRGPNSGGTMTEDDSFDYEDWYDEADEYLTWAGYDTDEWCEMYERTCSEV